MTNHFTLQTLLRQASRDLLGIYLTHSGIDLGIDVAKLKPRNIDPIIEAINRLPDDRRAALDRELREIWALASESGLRSILDEAGHQSVVLVDRLQPLDGFLDKAIWTFVNARAVFDGAARFVVRETLPARYWKRRLPLTGAPTGDLASRVEALEHAVCGFFQREGRGRSCHIDYAARGPRHWFFAFPEDYTSAPLVWSDGSLRRQPIHPAFEVIFVYDSEHGFLDLYVEGPKSTIEALWHLFADVVLGISELPPMTKPAYAIEALKSRSFAYIRPPGSPIIDVKVTRLGLLVLAGPQTTVSIAVDVPGSPDTMYSEIDRLFAQAAPQAGRYALSQAKVIGVRLKATLDPGDGKKLRSRTFDLSPKACALKHEGTDELLRQMLIDSGIDLIGRPGDAGGREARPASQLAAE